MLEMTINLALKNYLIFIAKIKKNYCQRCDV